MSNIFFILAALAAISVLASLFLGIGAMAKGDEAARKQSNKLMQARIVLQGVALLLFIIAVLVEKS